MLCRMPKSHPTNRPHSHPSDQENMEDAAATPMEMAIARNPFGRQTRAWTQWTSRKEIRSQEEESNRLHIRIQSKSGDSK